MQEPVLKNIKAHFKVCESQLAHLQRHVNELTKRGKIVKTLNFFILKKNKAVGTVFTYTTFPATGYINVTGIPSFQQIENCLQEFVGLFHLSRADLKDFAVDNITASGRFQSRLNLVSAALKLSRSDIFCQSSSKFPGIVAKFPKVGTILLFSSGKYSIVGAKWMHQATHIFLKVNAVLSWLQTTERDLVCAQLVDCAQNC